MNSAARSNGSSRPQPRIRVGKLSGAVGTHAHLDPAIEARVCERLGLKPAALSHAGRPARPARGVSHHAGAHRLEHRPLGHRVSPPAADRGARSGGILHRRPEGQLRDAAQAQPDHRRKAQRPRARRPRQCGRRAGKRRALARTRHQPFQRRAHHLARFVHPARLHAGEAAQAGRAPPRLSGEHGAQSRIYQRPLPSARRSC